MQDIITYCEHYINFDELISEAIATLHANIDVQIHVKVELCDSLGGGSASVAHHCS